MRARIRRVLPADENLRLVFAVLLTAALMTAAPAVGHGVEHAFFAHDSEAVDGKSAVGPKAGVDKRARKLVATNNKGLFSKGVVAGAAHEVINDVGPLPADATFNSGGGEHLLMASATAFRGDGSSLVGQIAVAVDLTGGTDFAAGYVMRFFANERHSHKTLPTIFRVLTLPKGPVEVTVREIDDFACGDPEEATGQPCTNTDDQDRFNVALVELP